MGEMVACGFCTFLFVFEPSDESASLTGKTIQDWALTAMTLIKANT